MVKSSEFSFSRPKTKFREQKVLGRKHKKQYGDNRLRFVP